MFGSPGKYEFSFAGVKAKSPRSRDISLCESEEGLVEEDEGDHLYFEVCNKFIYLSLFSKDSSQAHDNLCFITFSISPENESFSFI